MFVLVYVWFLRANTPTAPHGRLPGSHNGGVLPADNRHAPRLHRAIARCSGARDVGAVLFVVCGVWCVVCVVCVMCDVWCVVCVVCGVSCVWCVVCGVWCVCVVWCVVCDVWVCSGSTLGRGLLGGGLCHPVFVLP